MALFRFNDRQHFVDCSTIEVKPMGSGRFSVKTTNPDRMFAILGGKASGGSSREWFVHCPVLYGDKWHPETSGIAAIRAGIQG